MRAREKDDDNNKYKEKVMRNMFKTNFRANSSISATFFAVVLIKKCIIKLHI